MRATVPVVAGEEDSHASESAATGWTARVRKVTVAACTGEPPDLVEPDREAILAERFAVRRGMQPGRWMITFMQSLCYRRTWPVDARSTSSNVGRQVLVKGNGKRLLVDHLGIV